MPRRLVLAILTLVACQQAPATTFESGISNLARGPVEAAANERTAAAADEFPGAPDRGRPHPTGWHELGPAFAINATATLSPPGATLGTQIDFVTVGVDLVGATPGEVAAEFISPGNSMYVRLTSKISGARADMQHVDFVLPVAGTWIDSKAMTGTWYAHVYFQGTERLTQPFDLDP